MGTQSRAREDRVRWAGVIQQDAVGKVGGPDSDNREAKACLSGPGQGAGNTHPAAKWPGWPTFLEVTALGGDQRKQRLERQASVILCIHSPNLSPHLCTPRTSPVLVFHPLLLFFDVFP